MTASLQDSLAALRTTGETRLADPIAMEVFSNRLLSITEEMGNTLVRSSFSTNIKERKDCSVALFDGRGRLICQASHVPLHLGSLMGSVTAVLKACPIERMRDGDAFICNDPYLAGGTHMPDISIVTPVFIDGAVRFFAANIGHHSDVGGSVPGSISGTARSIFEEGLRIPVIRIVREGELDEDLLNLVSQNSREAEERSLDLKVQIATNERGKRLLLALANQMGLEAMTGAVDDLLAYTGRRLRNRIRDMQDGRASFVAYLDDDGVGGEPVPLQANVIVDGERLILDFTGSGPQARGAMNVAESALLATCYYVVKTLLDPELLPNSGMFSCVEVSSPAGSILNPSYPAPVGARSITCNKVARALFGAVEMDFVDPVRQSVWKDEAFRNKLKTKYQGFVDMFDAAAPGASIKFTAQPLFFDVTTEWAATLQKMVANEVPVDEGLDKLAESIDRQFKEAGLG